MPQHRRKPGRPPGKRLIRRRQPGGQLSTLLPLIKPLLRPALKFIGPIIAGELLKVGIQRAVKPKKGKGLRLVGQRGGRRKPRTTVRRKPRTTVRRKPLKHPSLSPALTRALLRLK